MKKLILTAVMALGLTSVAATTVTAESVTAESVKVCIEISNSIAVIAKFRDSGGTPEAAYNILIGEGVSEELTLNLLKLVYLQGPHIAPDKLGANFLVHCVSSAA